MKYLLLFCALTGLPLCVQAAPYAVVNNNTATVENRIDYATIPSSPPPGYASNYVAVAAGTSTVAPGWTYAAGVFTNPNPPPSPPVFTNPASTGCSASSVTLVANAQNLVIMGNYTSGVTGSCIITITANTIGTNVAHGWNCTATDLTTPADLINQITPFATANMTLSGTTKSGDIINLLCAGF